MARVILTGFAIVSAAMLLACSGTTTTPKEKAKAKREGTDIDARVMAEKFVRKFLKFPDDAEFEWGKDCGQTKPIDGKPHWVVSGKVKAANAFGAKLTHRYKVQLYKGKGETWHARYIEIDGEQVFYAEVNYDPPETETVTEVVDDPPNDPIDEPVDDPLTETVDETPVPEPPKPVSRTWTDDAGKYKIEAIFRGMAFGKVTLERVDTGKTVELPFEKLSPEDQEWIKTRR